MAGRYQTYPKYKTTGVGWIGALPHGWELKKLKFVAGIQTGTTPPTSKDSCFSDIAGSPWVKPDELNEFVPILHAKKYLTEEGAALSRQIRKGSVLVCCIGTIGKFGVAGVELFTNQQINSVSFNNLMVDDYGKYLIASAEAEHMRLANGNVVKILNTESQKNIDIPYPTLPEQARIANFLDHETARIDTLIDRQQQLIKLLKEKRQAVISHAVSKGLNPDAPMRDSGIEWLGKVPEHWNLIPLKHLCNFSGGGTPSKENLNYWNGGNIPWVSPKDMKTFWVTDTQDQLTELAVEESSTNYVESGALLMVVRSGILQRTIPIAINKVRVTLNQDMKALRFNALMDVEYAANFILGYQDSLLLEWSKEGATVESIEQEYLSGSLFPVPPVEEQKSINQSIKERMEIFQNLEERAIRGITLLQERRTALISAAVTGKIDVRNFQVEASHAS